MARLRPIQPIGRQDRGKVIEPRPVPDPSDSPCYRPMNFIKGIDDTVEMRVKPLPDKWNYGCVWIRLGKIERKIKRENLHLYPDHEIITYRR